MSNFTISQRTCISLFFTLSAASSIAEPNRVEFPKNIDSLIHYTTVNRGGITEHMLTSKEALDAIEQGQEMPNGTQVILADYRDNEIYR